MSAGIYGTFTVEFTSKERGIVMKINVSHRDCELLSAYLDRQLSSDECACLEARLQVDQELASTLDGFRRLKNGLHNLPHQRVPHNFTITPQMVGIHPTRRLTPIFGVASALATFMLLLVIAGDLTGFIAPTGKPVAAVPLQSQDIEAGNGVITQTPERQTSDAAATQTAETPPPSLKSVASPTVALVFSAPSAAYPGPSSISTAAGAGELVTPTSEIMVFSVEATQLETTTTMITGVLSTTQVMTPTLDSTEQLTLSDQPPEPALQESKTIGTNRLAVRLIEIVLVIIAIGTGLVFVLARRR
jgi:hypothetical protein